MDNQGTNFIATELLGEDIGHVRAGAYVGMRMARRRRSPLHPRGTLGFNQWAEVHKQLTKRLMKTGRWELFDDRGFLTYRSRDGGRRLGVASGRIAAAASPIEVSRIREGSRRERAIIETLRFMSRRRQAALFDLSSLPSDDDRPTYWLILAQDSRRMFADLQLGDGVASGRMTILQSEPLFRFLGGSPLDGSQGDAANPGAVKQEIPLRWLSFPRQMPNSAAG